MGLRNMFGRSGTSGAASVQLSGSSLRAEPPVSASVPQVQAMVGEAATFFGFDDPGFMEFMRNGGASSSTEAGITITPEIAMKNTTVLRCVSLLSFSIGMLPLHLRVKATKEKAKDHPLYRVLHRKPNSWQTAFEFRSLMQQRALTHGNAYALIVRSGPRIIQLVPLADKRVEVRQLNDWSLEYRVNGRLVPQRDIFHLRFGLSEDGFTGVSLVKKAADAIALAVQTERAAARLFRQGMIVGGALKHKDRLSPEAYARLQQSMEDRQGAEGAHRWMILEEGMDIAPGAASGKDAQAIENRKHQIEEVARPFGVPRPLLGVDDTSWGSGIDVLGQLFVRYGLTPWFEAWQQAIERWLLTDEEAEAYEAKFNAGGLLRGSMIEQADFWAKALGAGGQAPWALPEEARESFDWEEVDPGRLPPALGRQQTGGGNEPA